MRLYIFLEPWSQVSFIISKSIITHITHTSCSGWAIIFRELKQRNIVHTSCWWVIYKMWKCAGKLLFSITLLSFLLFEKTEQTKTLSSNQYLWGKLRNDLISMSHEISQVHVLFWCFEKVFLFKLPRVISQSQKLWINITQSQRSTDYYQGVWWLKVKDSYRQI